jgi:enoyl-CoA hydratase/carnithine racemase
MGTGSVKLTLDGAVARIVLSNPAKYNAMTLSMWTAIADTIAEIEARPDVRVIMLRGDGDKAFVSGADISEFESKRGVPETIVAYDLAVDLAHQALIHCSIPVVACMRGLCIGGGMGLALSCDLRYAARSTKFRMPAARMGLGYSYYGVSRMIDVIGSARASEVFYTARAFDGTEAERIGFVHRVFDDADYEVGVEQVLADIAANAPLSVRAAKLTIRTALSDASERNMVKVNQAIHECAQSADYAEGRRAFMEKRVPRFAGV